jgi:hypothetical protein
LTDQKIQVLCGRQLQEADWQWPVEVAHGIAGMKKRSSQGRNIVGSGLQIELPPPLRFLNEYLPVAEIPLCRVITRDGVSLPQSQTTDDAREVELAKRSRIEGEGAAVWSGPVMAGVGRDWGGCGCCARQTGMLMSNPA